MVVLEEDQVEGLQVLLDGDFVVDLHLLRADAAEDGVERVVDFLVQLAERGLPGSTCP